MNTRFTLHSLRVWLLTALLCVALGVQAESSSLLFHASFEETATAATATGSPEATLKKAAVFTEGVSGKALVLDGTTLLYTQQGNIDRLRGTAVFWIKPLNWDPAKSTKQYFWFFSANKGGGNVDRIQFFKLPNPTLYFMFGEQKHMQTILRGTGDWQQEQWRCFAIAWDEHWMKLYVDGKLYQKLKSSPEHLPVDTGDTIQLGSDQASAFDELRIFNRLLSDDEIRGYYHVDTMNLQKAAPPVAASTTDDIRISMVIPRVSRPPVLDGRAAAGEWDNTSMLGGFLRLPELEFTPRQTTMRACYDQQYIYLLLSSATNGQLQTKATEQDGAVYSDDSYEIFFATPEGRKDGIVYQLILNSADAHYDARKGDKSWNSAWKSKSTIADGVWTAEVAIPLQDIGPAPRQGENWLFNVARNWTNPHAFTNPTFNLAYSAAEGFATLTFGGEGEFATHRALTRVNQRIADVAGAARTGQEGPVTVHTRIKKATGDVTNKVSLKSFEAIPGEVIFEERREYPAAKSTPAEYAVAPEVKASGQYFLQTIITAGTSRLFQQVIPFKVADLLAVDLEFLSVPRVLNARWELGADIGKLTKLTCEITDSRGKAVLNTSVPAPTGTTGTIPLDIKTLRERQYTLKVTAVGALTTVTQTVPFQSFAEAEWLGFEKRLRGQHAVMPPWTPVKVGQGSIDTRMQQYRFGPGPFPTQIIADGQPILSGPVDLQVTANGARQSFTPAPRTVVAQEADIVTHQYKLTGKSLDLQVRSSCEFDGMMRFDVDLLPKQGQTCTLSGLALEIPVRAEIALMKLPFFTGKQKETMFTIDCTVGDAWADAFTPHMWVGNDDRGVAWFMESDAQFALKDESRAIELVRRGESVVLRVRIVDTPITLTGKRTYTFGIMGTPSTPLPTNWSVRRLASCTSTSTRPMITMGYTTGPEYHVRRGVPYPAKDKERFLKTVSTSPGIQNVVYATCNGCGSKVPEYVYYQQEWNNPNSRDTWTYLTSGEYHDGACPVSESWRDFFLYACKQARDEYGIDGLYYDYGTVMGCSNGAHGCGYDKGGARQRTFPIFADRELRKNIYRLFAEGGRDPYFVLHNYSQPVAPIASFCQILLDGEPYQQKTGVIGSKVTDDYSQLIPMPRLRAMFGKQWGMTPFLLVKFTREDEARPKPTRTTLAMTLPCGIQVWGFYCHIPSLNSAYGAQDRFKAGEAAFVPYWQQDGAVRANTELLAGYWKKPGAVLVAISNLSTVDFDGEITLDPAKLLGANAGKIAVLDAEKHQPIPVNGNTLRLQVEAKDFRLLEIRAE
jgi:hypothetical protein